MTQYMKKQRCVLVSNGNSSLSTLKNNINPSDYLVGVDRGAITLLINHYSLDSAIGDFDSVSQEELVLIKRKTKKIITFKSEKDYTDTELALQEVIKRGYKDIKILGGIGTRIDHTLANILLLEKYQKAGRIIKIIDEDNEIEIVIKKKIITKNPNLPNISLISLTDSSLISLIGFKYPLKNKKVKRGETLCISNELVSKEAKVVVKTGKVLIIKSKD